MPSTPGAPTYPPCKLTVLPSVGFGTAIQEGATSGSVWLRVVNFVVKAPGQLLWLPRGIGAGRWWTWWAGLLSLGGKPLGCRRARRLILQG